MGALHLGSESYSTDGTNGRVGIGTSSPGCVLDVNVPNSGTPTVLAFSNSGGGYADIAQWDYNASSSPNQLTLSLKHSRPFVISGGNVGVGVTSPNEKLEVAGRIRANTGFNVNGTNGWSGTFTVKVSGIDKTCTVSGGIITNVA
jgi:hypothetical protein